MGLSPSELVKEVLARRVRKTVPDHSLRPAAVFLMLYPKDGDYCILLNNRSEQVEYHKGEISFPGGTQDANDRDPLDTALRETEEEMGIKREDVTVLGELDEAVTHSGFRVRVYVGTIESDYPFHHSDVEIAEVLEVPIGSLQDPANLRVESQLDQEQLATSYAYAYKQHLIFGATARILRQFLGLVGDGLEKEEH